MKKLGAIDREDIYSASGFGNVLCEAAGVLRADVFMSVAEEVRDVVSCGGER